MPLEETLILGPVARDSELQRRFAAKIRDLGFEIIENDTSLIGPKQLDIYIPEKNFAIEVNGIYWHTEEFVGRHYHKEKRELCKKKGVTLVQVWEDLLWDKEPIVLRGLAVRLGCSKEKAVGARETEVRLLDAHKARKFFEENHIQGFTTASIYVALNSMKTGVPETVACCSFKKTGVPGEWTLERYATSCRVPGGFSKCLEWFKANLEWSQVTTFADLMWSDGALYGKTGWELDAELPPDYCYVYKGERSHKFNFRLKRFKEDPALEFREGHTEAELASLNGIPRLWDAGKYRWVLVNQ